MRKILFLMLVLLLVLALGLTACGGGNQTKQNPAPTTKGDAVSGQKLFTGCMGCHGASGEGVPNLGSDLTTSEFVMSKTDAELVEFIKVGRDPNDPLNTTGVPMPPKGSNPTLSDDDLYDIVAHIRSIQK
jgi:disulfide bond formation protein DsbB